MLSPKKIKHRKQNRRYNRRLHGPAQRGQRISFGEYGLMAMEPKLVTNRQIESARIAMTRHIRRGGKVWIRMFPDIPYTKKAAETRMGKGKGAPEEWVAAVKAGRIMFEIAGINKNIAIRALNLAAQKLPIRVKIVGRI